MLKPIIIVGLHPFSFSFFANANKGGTPTPPPMSRGCFILGMSREKPLPRPTSISNFSPGTISLIFFVPSPTTLYINVMVSSFQSQIDIGRRRKLPSSLIFTNCPGADMFFVHPDTIILNIVAVRASLLTIVYKPCISMFIKLFGINCTYA